MKASSGGAVSSGARFLVIAAAFVVVVAGLKAAAELVVPVLVAAFLALLCSPVLARLRTWGLPSWATVLAVGVGLLLVVVLFSGLIVSSVRGLTDAGPRYQERITELEGQAFTALEKIGVTRDQVEGSLDSAALVGFGKRLAGGLLGALSQLLVVLLIAIFLLAEAAEMPAKIQRAKGSDDLSSWERASEGVRTYMKIKAGVSLITGAAVTVLLTIIGVDFPILWGVVAFLFNFIPNIGSILAAIPAVLLALVQFGPGSAIGVGVGFLAINTVVGNVIEPRWMGRKLGLSPVIVLLSLIFWNWVLGPVGMLLSVPLTTVVRIAMEQSEDSRPLAVLMGNAPAETA